MISDDLVDKSFFFLIEYDDSIIRVFHSAFLHKVFDIPSAFIRQDNRIEFIYQSFFLQHLHYFCIIGLFEGYDSVELEYLVGSWKVGVDVQDLDEKHQGLVFLEVFLGFYDFFSEDTLLETVYCGGNGAVTKPNCKIFSDRTWFNLNPHLYAMLVYY